MLYILHNFYLTISFYQKTINLHHIHKFNRINISCWIYFTRNAVKLPISTILALGICWDFLRKATISAAQACGKHSASLIRIEYIYIVPVQRIPCSSFILSAKTFSFVRAFSLLRNESSIHAIGWWFGKYSAKTDCLSYLTAYRRRAFRPAHPQQYKSVRDAQQTLYPTGMVVSGRVNDHVCPDRDCFLPSGPGKPIQTALTVYDAQRLFNFVWSLLFFNLAQYLFAFNWLVILWLLILITTVLSDIQAGGASHAAVSRMRDLCGLYKIFHLSVKTTLGSLREHNRQSIGRTLARFCDCGVNPRMLKWVCWKLYQVVGKGRKIPFSEWCFLLSFGFLTGRPPVFPDGLTHFKEDWALKTNEFQHRLNPADALPMAELYMTFLTI